MLHNFAIDFSFYVLRLGYFADITLLIPRKDRKVKDHQNLILPCHIDVKLKILKNILHGKECLDPFINQL